MFVQSQRPMRVTTPLSPDALIVVGFQAHEAISQLFHVQLDLISQEGSVPFDSLLGQKVTVEWDLADGGHRYFGGVVSRFSQAERTVKFTRYRMELVPKLWFLTRTSQSRIFQHKNVPDILKAVFQGLDVSWELLGTYQPRDYCCQYRESDFAFASRLMEEEGIFYFFRHSENGHQMVVADHPQSHTEIGDVIYEETMGGQREEERVWHWEKTQELRSGKWTLWDHCFELPGRNLEASKTILESVQVGRTTHQLKVGGNDAWEVYDYPGGYAQRFDGVNKSGGEQASELQKIFEDNSRTVGIRMQAETTPSLVVEGGGNCQQFSSGHKFSLTRHFSDDGAYVITSVDHVCKQAVATRGDAGAPFEYQNRFTCIPAAVPYRPPRVTPQAVVRGTQTATVVGPPGEEIFTDKYSRVKVQFHWDRQGGKDADSSCWLRVATLWAGKQWGVVHIPRVGQEVVVDFLEGDPDQPIIVGSVYNAEQMPPYTLPDNKTQSGIKSRSSKSGGSEDFNEIRFEDKKGEEEVYIHAQKNLKTVVENDEARDVGHDRKTDIHRDDTLTIDRDLTVTVKKDRSAEITGDDTEKVTGNQTVKITGSLSIEVQSSEDRKVMSQTLTVVSSQSETVGTSRSVTVGSSDSLTVGATLTIMDGGGVQITSAGPLSITAPIVQISAAMLQVAGAVQCSSVISPTYTPGAGNMI